MLSALGINAAGNLAAYFIYHDKKVQTAYEIFGIAIYKANLRERRDNSAEADKKEYYIGKINEIEMEESGLIKRMGYYKFFENKSLDRGLGDGYFTN